jgi:RNA polymerase sigma-70 factor (ECF subfamily)
VTDADSEAMRSGLVEAIPRLRAFARSLCGDRDRADDLVQETITRALANRDKFQPGTNLNAWLVTILRNHFYSEGRKRRREVEDADGQFAARLADRPAQQGNLDMQDFTRALQSLPDEQREALILIGAGGFSYEEVSEISGVRVGTVKSRVSRARARLTELLGGPPGEVTEATETPLVAAGGR